MEQHSITTDNESNGILYEAAYDENDVLCFACDEDKTQKKQYVCPNCGRPMILRKSNNTGRYAKRPHFAHKADDVQDCKAEGVLHQTFKTKLYELLQEHLLNHKPFLFESKCHFFKEQHSGNLLKKVKEVYIEKDLGICRPDILLTDVNDKPYIAVEIVVTHYPEDNPIQYYKDNNIYLYQIDVQSFDDLKNIEEKAKHPDEFNYCTRPKCPTCDNYMKKREIAIKETICPICRKPHRISIGYDDDRGSLIPYGYNSEELNFALNNSVAFKLKYTGTIRWLDHTCPHCNPMPSDNNQIISLKPLTNAKRTIYYCNNCNNDNKTNIKQCDKCHRPLTKSTINLYQSKCHICNTPIIFADGETNDYRFKNKILKPYQFTQEQIDYAIGLGANISQVESGLYSDKFNANVCPKCGNYGNDGLYNVNNRLITFKDFVFCNYCNPTMSLPHFNKPKTINITNCKICGNTMITNTLFIVEAYCNICKKTMEVAFVQDNDGRCSFDFNSDHKDLASSQYGIAFTKYENYPIECPNCKTTIHKRDIDKYVSCKYVAHIPVTFCPYKYNKSREYFHTIIPHNSNKVIILNNLPDLHSWCEDSNNNMNEYDIIMLNHENNYNMLIETLHKYNQIDIHHLDPNAFITKFINETFPIETSI